MGLFWDMDSPKLKSQGRSEEKVPYTEEQLRRMTPSAAKEAFQKWERGIYRMKFYVTYAELTPVMDLYIGDQLVYAHCETLEYMGRSPYLRVIPKENVAAIEKRRAEIPLEKEEKKLAALAENAALAAREAQKKEAERAAKEAAKKAQEALLLYCVEVPSEFYGRCDITLARRCEWELVVDGELAVNGKHDAYIKDANGVRTKKGAKLSLRGQTKRDGIVFSSFYLTQEEAWSAYEAEKKMESVQRYSVGSMPTNNPFAILKGLKK